MPTVPAEVPALLKCSAQKITVAVAPQAVNKNLATIVVGCDLIYYGLKSFNRLAFAAHWCDKDTVGVVADSNHQHRGS